MSLSLPSDGELLTLDKNAERNKIACNFFRKAKQEKKIKTILGPALKSISNLKKKEKKFDLVFIDADKENYKNYYNQSLDLIEKNGLIIVDNVLWHGDVVDEKKQDKFTTIIREFNSYINKDKRTENLIIPVGDGLTVCRKL
jgi:predicted O-methyltransferase YrrM